MFTRGRKYGNDTVDVINKGCVLNFDTIACIRTCFLTVIAIATLVLVVLKIIKYHVYKHQKIHQYAIFYISAIECVLCASSVVVGLLLPQLEFAACFLRLLQLVAVCHLHWSLAARTPSLVQNVVNPVLCLYILYCTTVALMGMVDVNETWTECMRPYWLMLSLGDFLMVQLFVAVSVYVMQHTNGISSLACFKDSYKRDLWSIIVVYEVSSLVTVTFDAVMRYVGSEVSGCSAMFGHSQIFYSIVIFLFLTVKFFVPTWTILCIFYPVEADAHTSEVALASRYNTMETNMEPTIVHQYQRMETPSQPNAPNFLPFVSDFTSLDESYVPAVLAIKKTVSLSPDRNVLSTISEESATASIMDSPCSQREMSSQISL